MVEVKVNEVYLEDMVRFSRGCKEVGDGPFSPEAVRQHYMEYSKIFTPTFLDSVLHANDEMLKIVYDSWRED